MRAAGRAAWREVMAYVRYVACALLLLCPNALSRHDDDFAFDNSDEFQVELNANHSEIAKNGLRRLWGVPDTSAYVGHLFRIEIPKEAFTAPVVSYKIRSNDGRHVPSWLAVDSRHGLISGLPQTQDLGTHTFTVIAQGRTQGLTATDSFSIEVKKAEAKPHSKYGTCVGSENRLVLTILIDGAFHQIPPRQRIRALMQLASFMALDGDEFSMEPYKTTSRDQPAILSGVGSSKRTHGDATTAIYLNVGCGTRVWSRQRVLLAGVREQARDGTLAHVLRLPVLGWRLVPRTPPRRKRQSPVDDGSGDYDDMYDDEDDFDGEYSGWGDDDDKDLDLDDNIDTAETEKEKYPEFIPNEDKIFRRVDEDVDPVGPTPLTPAPHPHRHHHGENDYAPHTTTDTFQTETTDTAEPTASTSTPSPSTRSTPSPSTPSHSTPVATSVNTPPPKTTTDAPTTAETTPEPATTNAYTTEVDKVKITAYSEASSEAPFNASREPISPRIGHSPIFIYPVSEDLPTTTETEQTVIIRESNELPPSSGDSMYTSPILVSSPEPVTSPSPSTTPSSTTTSTTPTPNTTSSSTSTSTTTVSTTSSSTTVMTTPFAETTVQEVTKQETVASSEGSSTIFGRTTETVTFAMPINQAPTLKHHMKKLAITAGKAFRYIIPADLFTDPEDGTNLTFTMYESEKKLGNNSWIQFIPTQREVYGLPLEEHVSRWHFNVEAKDSEGLIARGPLDITVQQHRSGRTVNHQFVMGFRLNKSYEHAIDWQIRALEGIVNLFRDTDMDHLTVLNATRNGDMCEFVWTNDTLPKDSACPREDIDRLMKILESETEAGSPSSGLTQAMSPELKVASVSWRATGRCATGDAGPVATRQPDTYPPVTRNQVDHITATAGHLLVYKVPEDTFFDPEDGGTRNLALSLRYSDRSELMPGHWLQFDARNQEFYGLPAPGDEGVVHYQLIAEDSSKKSAYDSLIVEVVKAPTIRPTVEFQMTMEYPFPELAYNTNNKRKVVEKLAALFGQKETDNIRIQSITEDPTTIVWYNTSLPMDRCPKKEIEELRKMIIVDSRTGSALKENVDLVFDKDLKVMSIRLLPFGLCADQNTKVPKTITPVHTGTSNLQNNKAGGDSGYSEYLVTFVIPAVVIVCMILVAGLIACVLYRRRRTAKMTISDEEERQAFRSKGIPVIFQDELEERTDTEPVHKSPVIMREEKPPLLPPAPDYRSADDVPYRPPPPFAASRTPPRPKATPTYRKPPPYVPP